MHLLHFDLAVFFPKNLNTDRTLFSTPENFTSESRKSSLAQGESSKILTNNRCVLGRKVSWKIFKICVFLTCFTCLIIQAVEFYNRYSEYPTNILLETRMIDNFELPAITLCYRNSISSEEFCSDYPDLCEKPNDLEEFCRLHPHFCTGNRSALVIPKHGYFTNYSDEVEGTAQRLLLNESENLQPFGESSGRVTTTFIGTISDRLMKCYSINLQLDPCNPKLATRRFGTTHLKEYFIGKYPLQIRKLETFYPWGKLSAMMDFHSPFIPTNILIDGHIITSGFVHVVDVQVETEELLLPSPYQTNCRDYTDVDKETCIANKTRNPSSYQMCLELCNSDFFMECAGCDLGLTMNPSANNLCWDTLYPSKCKNAPGLIDELYEKLDKCEQNCKPNCRKLTYKHKMTKWRNEDFYGGKKGPEAAILFLVKKSEYTLMKHVPLYGNGDLFSHFGGLIGCWLGISVWTFTDIMEKIFKKATRLRIKRRLRMKSTEIADI